MKLDKEVALKLIRSRAKANSLAEARFDRELRAVGKLDHPNTVRALDAGEFNGTTFRSMELLQGLDHRDIKPSNLMLCKDPVTQVRVKVMDLGLAFVQGDVDDERLTSEGIAVGTYRYMSLEQSRNAHTVDHRADIDSSGATLYRSGKYELRLPTDLEDRFEYEPQASDFDVTCPHFGLY